MSKYIKLLIFSLITNFFATHISASEKSGEKYDRKSETRVDLKEIIEALILDNTIESKKIDNIAEKIGALQEITKNITFEQIKKIFEKVDYDFILKIYKYLNNRDKLTSYERCCCRGYDYRENLTFSELVGLYHKDSRDRFITDMFNCHTILKYQNCFNKLSNRRILTLYNFFKKNNFETKEDYYKFKEDLSYRTDLSYDAFSRPKCFIIFALLATVAYYAFKNIDFNSQTGQTILMGVYSLTTLILLTICGDCCIKTIENNPRIFQFCVVALLFGYIMYDTYYVGPHYINNKDLR